MNSKVCLSDFMHIDFTGTLTYRLHVGAAGQPTLRVWSVCSNHDTHERFVRDGLTRPIQHGFSTEYHVTRTARTHPPTYTHARYATPRFTPRDKSLGFIATCHVLLRVQQAVRYGRRTDDIAASRCSVYE